jgi:hypothetical protein
VLGCGADCAVKIKFVMRAITRPAAQALQGNFDVACSKLDFVIEVAVLTTIPDFDAAPNRLKNGLPTLHIRAAS